MRISPDGRRLLRDDGQPFFYLADTAWELFHHLDLPDAELYLTTRAAQKFNVIQAVVLPECDSLRKPNVLGELPFWDLDPTRPNEAYFGHIDRILQLGADQGLTWGLLPTWGDKWTAQWGAGPVVFTPENTFIYGKWLARRYREVPLIWILGGDRCPKSEAEQAIVRAMAAGLRDGDGGTHLMTYHPGGWAASSTWFHDETWLDFNMIQTGHQSSRMDNVALIAADYARSPAKPCLDGEPPYENHPDNAFGWDAPAPYFDDYITRRAAWQAIFAGACGNTYGCHDIWQMCDGVRPPINRARTLWKEALHFPGARQMQHLRTLMEQLPFADLAPDPALVSCMPSGGPVHVLHAKEAGIALVYFPDLGTRTIHLGALAAKARTASWYDPAQGTFTPSIPVPDAITLEITPPEGWRDAVWVVR